MGENRGYKLLLVEDDPNFGSILTDYLRMHDHNVTLATDGAKGLQMWKKENFDMAILDVMMPEMDGFTLAEHIREEDSQFPFLFLTAKGLKDDILKGFSLGADDYIVKPFDSEVLLMKIQAVMNRLGSHQAVQDEYTVGQFLFQPKLRILQGPGGSERVLSPKEGELLTMLLMYKNDLLKRSDALKRIWKDDNYFTGRSMDVYIAKLRKYLREDSDIEIVNVHSEGFRLIDRSDS
jgi:DNA-binding response OmpR family regulator